MTIYEKELQELRPYDEVQYTKPIGRGYNFIVTAGHGYLVVPLNDIFASVAKRICGDYGYIGKNAIYLEEDGEAPAFKKAIA